MQLVEKHIITKSNPFYKEADELCFKSKNVYNSTLYQVRQEFFQSKKYLNYNTLASKFKENESFKALPAKVSQQIMKLVDQNFKSFFGLLKKKKSNNYDKKVKIPSYLDSVKGRQVVVYTNQAISTREFKQTGLLHLSKTNIKIRPKIKSFDSIAQVRIVPRIKHFVIEVIYEKTEKDHIYNGNIAAIDIGLNNLAALTFNSANNPNLINGRPLKSINQYYNKKKARLKSILEKRNNLKTSNKLQKLEYKRKFKIDDYLHKKSKKIVNQLVSNNSSVLIIGENKEWKQDISIGSRNNQNFVNIPFDKFKHMLDYKCQLQGIKTFSQEESYTSKCSFLDNEEIKKHEEYKGSRIKRGLFRSSSGKLINADLNGSYNIMRKFILTNTKEISKLGSNISDEEIEGLRESMILVSSYPISLNALHL